MNFSSAALIPEWFELYLGDNTNGLDDTHSDADEVLNPITVDADTTNNIIDLLANLHDLELDEDAWALHSVCKCIQFYRNS